MCVELAPAKVNLTLDILGRLANGYHALHSLVVFAGPPASDLLTVVPSDSDDDSVGPGGVEVVGRFAASLDGENLIVRAQSLLNQMEPRLNLPGVRLEKRIPVAAGLGGGSADAAAYLRIVQRRNPGIADRIDWTSIAVRLGADVAVCLRSVPTVMTGIGDRLAPFALSRPIPAVLVNPMCPVPATKTRDVFARLGAGPVDEAEIARMGPLPNGRSLDRIVREGRNDLAAPATDLMPEMADAASSLREALPNAVVRLSGAGPTLFAIVDDQGLAARTADAIQDAHPAWWAVAVELGPADPKVRD